ncbi:MULTISPECIES: family 16 glycosylhydrolase [unclassified Micromonospora]|uniref:ricin-type beta-trefoil lectin domain protein n=1 Tax=unclassified Micromonospora TaxID=2617518 RepID=UPI001C235954|nr:MULTISPECIES: family 16 glycosylhydrolase [unclassified Micromonospora]MBU8861109.1 family 16 glycosylhydrolase [Micromonospora sp. WMMB482]MDM4780657.1 family 16 glycosylhydrolase [Micromonospora sp. b486]
MRTIRTLAALAVTAVGLTAALAVVPHSPAVAAPDAVTWSDDFNGPAGSAPDANKWRYDIGGGGWGNNELQYYTNSTRNAALDGNGNLVITARRENPGGYSCWYGSCQYTSARLLTNGTFAQAYGRFEARIKVPRGQGLWPAFWMLGNDIGTNPWPGSGEIDIMENVGYAPSTVWGTLHGPGYSGGNSVGASTSLPNGQALADAFHTFTVDWAPDSITWYLDGVAYSRKTPADLGGNRWVFDHPFFMIMNVAVGGNWPGSPDGNTTFPQTMTIDYVRVQAWDNGGGGTVGQIVGYGNKCVDVASAGTANGTPVQLWTCNGTAAQRWAWNADGSVRALGKCLDVAAGSTASGAKVQLYDCNGTGAQKWVFSAAGDIVNPQANKCLDATGPSSADGTRLQIWDCTGAANQKWRR